MEDETTPELQEYFGSMNRPIAGESLTEDPDETQPYVDKPEFTVPQEAIDYLFDQMTEEEHYTSIMQGILGGTTVMELTRLLLFSGFNEGKWNPDLMMMLIEPTAYLIMGLAERAEIEYEVMEDDEEDMFGVSVDRLEMKDPDELSEETQEVLEKVEDVDVPESVSTSLMARPPPQEAQPESLMSRQV